MSSVITLLPIHYKGGECPEKVIAIMDIKREIEVLKKSDDGIKELQLAKFDALKEQQSIQNNWVIAIAIAILGTLLAIWIPNIVTRRTR